MYFELRETNANILGGDQHVLVMGFISREKH